MVNNPSQSDSAQLMKIEFLFELPNDQALDRIQTDLNRFGFNRMRRKECNNVTV